jgi:hypothetical protein
MLTSSTPDALLVIAPPSELEQLDPWMAAHRCVREVIPSTGAPGAGELRRAAGVFHCAIAGPRFYRDGERLIPAGYLPRSTRVWIAAAATVAARSGWRLAQAGPAAVLSQRTDRAMSLADDIHALLAPSMGARALHWGGDRLAYFRLAESLAPGLGFIWYFGQGTAGGWAGYTGVTSEDLHSTAPTGALLSLTCETGRAGGFCEALVLKGFCAAALAASGRTSHKRNRRLARALALAITDEARPTLASILSSAKISWLAIAAYRILGDPLAPLIGDVWAEEQARRVFAPAPDDHLAGTLA